MRQIAPAAAALALSAACAAAQDWRPMGSDEIAARLTEKKLTYELGWQEFYASGRTRYRVGNDDWGWWEARDDRYCSLWPPQTEWTCYGMTVSADGTRVQFIGEDGDAIEGVFTE